MTDDATSFPVQHQENFILKIDNSYIRKLMQHDKLRELAIVLTQRVRQNVSISRD